MRCSLNQKGRGGYDEQKEVYKYNPKEEKVERKEKKILKGTSQVDSTSFNLYSNNLLIVPSCHMVTLTLSFILVIPDREMSATN